MILAPSLRGPWRHELLGERSPFLTASLDKKRRGVEKVIDTSRAQSDTRLAIRLNTETEGMKKKELSPQKSHTPNRAAIYSDDGFFEALLTIELLPSSSTAPMRLSCFPSWLFLEWNIPQTNPTKGCSFTGETAVQPFLLIDS